MGVNRFINLEEGDSLTIKNRNGQIIEITQVEGRFRIVRNKWLEDLENEFRGRNKYIKL